MVMAARCRLDTVRIKMSKATANVFVGRLDAMPCARTHLCAGATLRRTKQVIPDFREVLQAAFWKRGGDRIGCASKAGFLL